MNIGICTRAPAAWIEEFRQACDQLQLAYRLVDISRHDWMRQLEGLDVLLWRIHLGDQGGLEEARLKIPIAEGMGVTCFPNRLMAEMYDDKIAQAFFLERNGHPGVQTFVSFSQEDALAHVRQARFPLVAKTSGGASSSGVRLIRSREEAERIVHRIFRRKDLWKRIKYRLLPQRKEAGSFEAAYRLSALRPKADYVLFQEFVASEGDLRVATVGPNTVAAFWRRNRPNDFRASGSGLLEAFDEKTIPSAACDLALAISRQHGFTCMAYDFLPQGDRWLITEISYTFILKRKPWDYTDALYQRVEGGYKKLARVPLGVLHLQSVIESRSNPSGSCS